MAEAINQERVHMKKLFAFVVAFALIGTFGAEAYADGCYLCASGSTCQQCRYTGSDTSEQRKKCEAIGCKISGTASCSTAANVKVCSASLENRKIEEMLAFGDRR